MADLPIKCPSGPRHKGGETSRSSIMTKACWWLGVEGGQSMQLAQPSPKSQCAPHEHLRQVVEVDCL